MTNAFSSHIKLALDSYQTQQLSAGFTDKLVEKALNQSSPGVSEAPTSSWKRRKTERVSPWKRGGFIVSSVVGLGLISAAAAAALSLAEIPIRIPVISDLVETVLPESTVRAVTPVKSALKTNAGSNSTRVTTSDPKQLDSAIAQLPSWKEMPNVEKRGLIKERVLQNEKRLQQRRAKNGLPPLSPRQFRRRRENLKRAVVQRSVRRAHRDLRKEARQIAPAISAELKPPIFAEAVAMDSSKKPLAKMVLTKNETTAIAVNNPEVETASREDVILEPSTALPADQSAKPLLEKLSPEAQSQLKDRLPVNVKARLKKASPADRQRILREARKRRNRTKTMRQTRRKIRDIRKRAK